MKKRILTIVSLLLVCVISFNFYGCTTAQAANLMDGIMPNDVLISIDTSENSIAVTDFAIRLFKASVDEGNTLISPLSVLCALSMTANGAKGETLRQMEEVLEMTADELNFYLYSYMNSLPKEEKYKLSLANSIWFKDDARFEVNREFLQTNADYYGADVYKSPFDNSALDSINSWVNEKTDGMIPKILDGISKDAVMFLVNALAFEAEWAKVYEKNQVKDGIFTTEDGRKQDVQFMYSSEGAYLEDENAVGFIKYYSRREYAFAALLPKEGVSLSDCVAALDGERLNGLLNNPDHASVNAAIPKFETGYEVEMSEILANMGMPLAFDPDNADFSNLGIYDKGNNNLYISKVVHKTFISVAEKGTKAGAATIVHLEKTGAAMPVSPKQVYLDKPFVYMLIDCKNNIPFFIGTMTDIEK